MTRHTIHFDVSSDRLVDTMHELLSLLQLQSDLETEVEIFLFGPAGGNSAITIKRISDDTLPALEEWLTKNFMTWSDESGKVYEKN